MLSPEYQAAVDTHDQAYLAFSQVREAWRRKQVDDTAYCAAHATFKTATAVFDAAFEAEQSRPPPPALRLVNPQLQLL